MLLFAIPMCVIFVSGHFDDRFVVNSLDRRVPLRQPDPRPASTVNTPCPRPAFGVEPTGVTVGPFDSTNAGEMLSSVLSETVCRNGNDGVVKGVVIPAISIQTSP
jgi:hypothetical protein